MGAWIEMSLGYKHDKPACVAPFMGAWIEIAWIPRMTEKPRSLPSWERGLKYAGDTLWSVAGKVAPFMGAWIEISL